MNPSRLLLFAAITLMAAVSPTLSAPLPQPSATTVVLVGERLALDRKVEFSADPDALGGIYVAPTSSYQILVRAAPPPSGEILHVWVRYRGLALQLKARVEGRSVEFPWNWTRHPDRFAWRRVGVFPRARLGDSVWLINDPRHDSASGIDAFVITADASWRPDGADEPLAATPPPANPDVPDAANATVRATVAHIEDSDAPGRVSVSIDWSRTRDPVAPFIYSLNGFHGHDPARMSSPAWHEGIRHMAPRFLRLHSAGLVRGWFDEASGDWRRERIAEALENGRPPEGVVRMININSWPRSFDADEDGRLDPGRIDDFARLCAELVRFVNVERGLGIAYWEVTNEKDFAYWRKPRNGNQPDVAALAGIYNRAAAAMRAVDPSIKIGGPAACSPLPVEPLVEFAKLAREQLDFFSFHHYATGDNTDADQIIYEKAGIMAADAAALIRAIEAASPPPGVRPLEYHLNEFNICYNWRIPEPRMADHKGAVFDALSLIAYAAVPGLTAACAWNDFDGVYGKLDGKGAPRPGAHVYHYFNTYLHGRPAEAATGDARSVVPFAITDGREGRRSFVLVNRTSGERVVTLAESPATEGGWRAASVSAAGLTPEEAVAPFAAPVTLAPHSVSFYWVNRPWIRRWPRRRRSRGREAAASAARDALVAGSGTAPTLVSVSDTPDER